MLGQPQLLITIDRDKSSRYAINTNDILDVVETSIGGKAISMMIEGERRFSIVLRFSKDFRTDPDALQNISVSTPAGGRIPLVQLADIQEGHGATQILRDRNQRRIAVKANVRGRDMMSAVQEAQRLVKEQVKLPEGYHIVWGGQFERAQHAARAYA